MLQERIAAAEVQMKAKLAEARASFAHRGIRGDHAEAALRFFLRQYMPRRFSIGTGEVVDSQGARSSQTDVVIANEDHPFTFSDEEPGLFFVEGVSAAAEVKAVLTREQLQTTIENSRSWKRLLVNPGKGTTAHANPEDQQRFYQTPPYFLFAFESQLSLATIEKVLLEAGSYADTPMQRQLDAVLVLDRGAIIDFGHAARVKVVVACFMQPVALFLMLANAFERSSRAQG
jgi:hypothetical protein